MSIRQRKKERSYGKVARGFNIHASVARPMVFRGEEVLLAPTFAEYTQNVDLLIDTSEEGLDEFFEGAGI